MRRVMGGLVVLVVLGGIGAYLRSRRSAAPAVRTSYDTWPAVPRKADAA